MKIGIAGVGGIGSNVAMHLVRSGFTDFKFGDFDKIEESNLNRQFYFQDQIGKYKAEMLCENLKRINKKGHYFFSVIKFDRDNIKDYFSDCDIIVDGFDKKEYKSLLVEEFYNSGKLLICVSGIGGKNTESIVTVKKGNNFYIVGDLHSDIDNYATYSHKVCTVAAKVAEIILQIGCEND